MTGTSRFRFQMTQVVLITSITLSFVSNEALACRSAVQHDRPSRQEAYKTADLVVSGYLSMQKSQGFSHDYELEMEKAWKGKDSGSKVRFAVEHHSCAKYRSNFQEKISPDSSSNLMIGYFKKKNGKWQLIRLVPSEDTASEALADTRAREVEFLKTEAK